MQRVEELIGFLRKRRRDITIITLWTVVLVLVIIKTHQVFYLTSERFQRYEIPYLQHVGPRFDGYDITIIIIAGFLAGFFLIDVKNVVYGYFASMLLTSVVSTFYVFIYIWSILGWGGFWSMIDFGWEYALFQAFLNVTRFMFPLGILFSLVGVVTGSVIRNWVSFF